MLRTNDGQPIRSNQPADIVKELHKLSDAPSESDRSFMRDTAARVQRQFGKKIRHDCAEHFVTDLVGVGLLIEEEAAE
jgi:hypothetical protein